MKALNVNNFHSEIQKDGLKLVIFVNPGCQVCELVYPNVEAMGRLYEGRVTLFKVDAKAEKALMQEFSLNGVPQVLFFKDGNYLGKMAGPQDVEDYSKKIEEILA